MPSMQGRGGRGHDHPIRVGAQGLRRGLADLAPLNGLLLILTMQIGIRRASKKARPAGLGAGPGNHHTTCRSTGEASPAQALKCVQSGIFLPRFAIFRTVPISFGLAHPSPPAAAAMRPARPATGRRQMSRRACRAASSQTMSLDAQGLAAKIRGVDCGRRAGSQRRCATPLTTLSRCPRRRPERGDAPRNQPIVAWSKLGPSSRCVQQLARVSD
jgi:hypothetical protein